MSERAKCTECGLEFDCTNLGAGCSPVGDKMVNWGTCDVCWDFYAVALADYELVMQEREP